MHENPEYLLEALKAGAAGYLLEDVSQRDLISAVRQVLSGEPILDRQLMTRLLRSLTCETPSHADLPSKRLSPRELEVLHLLIQGHTNREIASTLMVSVSTAKNHVEHVLAKLGVSDRTQAAVRALELGLFQTTLDLCRYPSLSSSCSSMG
jgi:DNA-binding NarL/FixJ family response regulator